jgi:phosphatidylserine/phosphatidylglycerophosphate/cardiolipin synthase-like enzyme
MGPFAVSKTSDGFTCKLWRGERMCLLGFDVSQPEPDLAGFSIECKAPGAQDFAPLLNRIAFSYDKPSAVNGDRLFDSREAPFQKFRWIHFPWNPQDGTYRYRVSKRHMSNTGKLIKGTQISLGLDIAQETYGGYLDIGFTRNFASSQAYRNMFGNRSDIIPKKSEAGLSFKKLNLKNAYGESVYDWLGFEAKANLFRFLDDALKDKAVKIEVMAYDLNEPDILARLEKFKSRLQIIIDDSISSKDGVKIGHGLPHSPESIAAKRLATSAGKAQVKRMHFGRLQHNKVFITRRGGVAEKVLCGSTNFTFRGLYIQANNVLVFHNENVAGLFARAFEIAFNRPKEFKTDPFSRKWHAVSLPGNPSARVCFSPHGDTDLSLNPVAAAIDQATSSVLYSVAFLNQMKSGPTFEAFNRLEGRNILSYGTVDQKGKLKIIKPDGSEGLVDFKYLSAKAPEPFKSEWSGGEGRNVHHKFVITDFDLPTARVFTGSSNLSPSGEEGNGDHLVMIEDQRVAAAYAIEAVRVFDHLEFRNKMREHDKKLKKGEKPPPITLKLPTALSGKPTWFERYYVQDSQRMQDRLVFST